MKNLTTNNRGREMEAIVILVLITAGVLFYFFDIDIKVTRGKGSWLKPSTWFNIKINKE